MSTDHKVRDGKSEDNREKRMQKEQQKKEKREKKHESRAHTRWGRFINRFDKKGTKTILIIAGIVVLVLIGNSILTRQAEQSAVFMITPDYQPAERGDVEVAVAGEGNLDSGSSLTFEAKTDIAVETVIVQEGQRVKAGDVIATLDADGMKDILAKVFYDLNEMQAAVDASDDVEDTYYIKANVSGRLKDVQVEEDDLVEDAMADKGYIALISTVEEMKIEITADEYQRLSEVSTLVVRSEGYKYDEDITLRYIDDKPYVIVPNDFRTIGAEADIYSAAATKEGNELASGTMELVAYEKLMGTYGVISYQDDFENYTVDKGEVLFHVDKYKYTLENNYYLLDELREEYNYCLLLNDTLVLTAPYDGIITQLALEDDTITPDGTAISIVKSDKNWQATVAVDELDISKIAIGQEAIVTIDALDYQEFLARVESISSAGVSNNGITSYDVVLKVEANDGFLISMSVTCEIIAQSAEDVITIPSSAVRTFGDIKYVMAAVDRPADEKAKIRNAIQNGDLDALAPFIGMNGAENTEALPEGFNAVMLLSDPVELLYGDIRLVEVGLDNGTTTEIISGLGEGETVMTLMSGGALGMDSQQSGFMFSGGGPGGGRPQ